ncbi:MAG: hypothetical protein AB1730_12850 [Myxococcota bacterium]
MMRLPTMLSVLALAACGGTNPGWGTQTLYVSARLSTNGSTGGTSARVEVREGGATGAVVTNAEVKLRGDKLESRTLAWRDQGNNGGVYVLDTFAWDTTFILDVTRGSDTLSAALSPPGASILTAPIAGTTFRRADGVALKVEWKDDWGRRAENTTLSLEKAKIDQSWANGSEPYRVEFATNRLTADKERIELSRSNEVNLAGGSTGSTMRATTTHRIEFTVE